ncbi:MAG: CsbD family protein [Pseudomonadota bacterium]
MNKQQIKGAANEAAGKVEKAVGKATSNGTLTVKGAVRELGGKAEKAIGDVKAKGDKAMNDEKRDARTTRDREMERSAR